MFNEFVFNIETFNGSSSMEEGNAPKKPRISEPIDRRPFVVIKPDKQAKQRGTIKVTKPRIIR